MLAKAQTTQLQKRAVNSVINLFEAGETSVLIQSMTGSGKTFMGMDFVDWYLTQDFSTKVMIVVPTVALVEQFVETAAEFGLLCGIYHGELTHRDDNKGNRFAMPQLKDVPGARICVTLPDTFATLIAGTNHYGWEDSWVPTLLWMDEAHKNTSANSQAVRDRFDNLFVLGTTATPRREQNKGGENLLEWYGDNLIIAATPQELIAEKRIVPPRIMQFTDKHVEVEEWKLATAGYTNKCTIIVARDSAHAYALTKAFQKNNISARQITSVADSDGEYAAQTVKQRQKLLAEFRNGEFDVLVSVDTVCEGFDCPRAQFVMICRSMTSEALYHQVVGRVLRTYPGKIEGIVLDFGGNHVKFGSIIDRVWTVADYAPVTSLNKERTVGVGLYYKSKQMMIVCNCDKVYDAKARTNCPACNRETNIKVTCFVKDIFSVYNFSTEEYKKNGKAYQGIATSKVEKNQMRDLFNMGAGIEVFGDKGAVHPDHEIFADILRNNKNLGDTIVLCLRTSSKYVLDRLAA